MAQITLTFNDPDEIRMATELAESEGLSMVDYFTNLSRSFIQHKIKGKYLEYTNTSSISSLTENLGHYYELPQHQE